MSLTDFVLDTWTPLSFKRALDTTRTARGKAWTAPTWVGSENDRRLLAYTVLGAYYANAARHFLQTSDPEVQNAHREYGDAALLRSATLSALLGDEQRLATDGADDVPERVQAVDENDEPRTDEQGEPIYEELAPEVTAPLRLQEWLEQWAERERLPVKLQLAESAAVGLGDGVYVLGWSSRKRRPTLRVYDPGFYFPVLDPMDDEEFPRRVHIAWELPDEGDGKLRLRRMTWELGPIEMVEGPVDSDEEFVLRDGDRWDEERYTIVRTVPWSDEPVTETCYLTDAVWVLDKEKRTVADLGEPEYYLTNEDGDPLYRVDTGYDFVPVVHVPNTIAGPEHFGQASISVVLQILDDLSNADTDLQAASGTTGTPPIALSGASMGKTAPSYKPGTVWELGPDGKLSALDTSPQLAALANYVDGLVDRMTVNARLPAALLGRVDPSEVPSGLALSLSFGPLVAMVREMRLAREEKYILLTKFIQRIALAGGVDDVPTEYFPTRMRFGSFLPADESSAVTNVSRLLEAKAISVETGVRVLMDAGFPIEDAVAEVARILGRDFSGANELLDATGDQGIVDKYLSVERTMERPPPPPADPPADAV